jgi:hypothetical protein
LKKKENSMSEQSLKDFRLRVDAMKALITELDQTILNPEARDHFLSFPKGNLREAEAFLADANNHTVGIAGPALALAETRLVQVKKLVEKYGRNIHFAG